MCKRSFIRFASGDGPGAWVSGRRRHWRLLSFDWLIGAPPTNIDTKLSRSRSGLSLFRVVFQIDTSKNSRHHHSIATSRSRSRFDGTLIKEFADPKIFLVTNGQLSWVTSPSSMDNRCLPWRHVRTVPNAALASLPRGPDLN
jgi:hypothetical protein